MQDDAACLNKVVTDERRIRVEVKSGVSNLCAKLHLPETSNLVKDLEQCMNTSKELR